MARFAIGLGSNMGDRLDHLQEACAALSDLGENLQVSSLYESEPVGGPEQDPYLNAVATIETNLTAPALLDRLHEIESSRQRERRIRWGPRTLDLDIVTSDGEHVESPELTIPHPRAIEREFVLAPLAEVWTDAPVAPGVNAGDALSRLPAQGVDRLVQHWYPRVGKWPGRLLVAGQLVFFLAVAVALATDGRLPEGEVTALGVIGALMAMVGLVMAFVSSRRLGPAMTADPAPKDNAVLVVSGPYRYVRHPIYGGVIMVLLGTSMFLDSLVGGAISLLLVPYFWVKAGYEEKLLRMRFSGYQAYRAVVTRRLIPFVI